MSLETCYNGSFIKTESLVKKGALVKIEDLYKKKHDLIKWTLLVKYKSRFKNGVLIQVLGIHMNGAYVKKPALITNQVLNKVVHNITHNLSNRRHWRQRRSRSNFFCQNWQKNVNSKQTNDFFSSERLIVLTGPILSGFHISFTSHTPSDKTSEKLSLTNFSVGLSLYTFLPHPHRKKC